jgi:hypothetical protein
MRSALQDSKGGAVTISGYVSSTNLNGPGWTATHTGAGQYVIRTTQPLRVLLGATAVTAFPPAAGAALTNASGDATQVTINMFSITGAPTDSAFMFTINGLAR